VKHVFVETNFLVDLLRPLPSADAEALFERFQRGELQLYVPWASVSEAKRTLDRIMADDLGFDHKMLSFGPNRRPPIGESARNGVALARFGALRRPTRTARLRTRFARAIA
jgi:hypothetical protein